MGNKSVKISLKNWWSDIVWYQWGNQPIHMYLSYTACIRDFVIIAATANRLECFRIRCLMVSFYQYGLNSKSTICRRFLIISFPFNQLLAPTVMLLYFYISISCARAWKMLLNLLNLNQSQHSSFLVANLINIFLLLPYHCLREWLIIILRINT